jgi:hypothetical protein
MTVRRLLLVALLTVATFGVAGTGEASACSCADSDPRDRIEEGAPAFIGRVVSAPPRNPTPPLRFARYVVRVEREVNIRLADRIVLRTNPYSSSCGVSWHRGERVGAFLHRTRLGWTTNLCSLATARDLERATRPYPRPVGRGRIALLAGGSFGDARLMALDERGRILGYGLGEGAVRRISVCPGGRAAAELADRGLRRSVVAVRSLESLEILSVAEVPRHTAELACADAGGATVYAGGIDYRGRPSRGRAEVHRVTGSTRTTLVRRPAEQFALAADAAYVWTGGRVLAISLADVSERSLLRVPLAERIVPSPFGGQVAVHGHDGLLRRVDLATGAVTTRRLATTWGLDWLAPDRLLARIDGSAVVLDGDLRRMRRYAFRAVGEAHVGGALFGTDRYRLVRLDLASGSRRTAARLPDRGIAELVGVPDGPEVDLPRRAPRLMPTRPLRAARCGTGPSRKPPPGAPGSRGPCARCAAAAHPAGAA